MAERRLPPALTSVYRLFLRAASASVLHHTVAARNLRRLWRPTFEAAALTEKRLMCTQDVTEQSRLKEWLDIWNKRMDGTLALLYNSATSRGLPHKVTRNLSFLLLSEHRRSGKVRSWQPQNKYPIDGKVVDARNAENARVEREMGEKARGALDQVLKLAEARNDISLGHVPLTRGTQRSRY